jgi:hypothetical protein
VLEKDGDNLDQSCENEEVLLRVKEERSILHTIKRTANWTRRILCRNCRLKQVIEGKTGKGRIEVREVGEEDMSSYWVNLRKRENTGNCKMKH